MSEVALANDVLGTKGKYIRNSPLGLELTDGECNELAEIVSIHHLQPGDFLLKEGHKDDSLHVLVSGKLEVIKSDQGGGFVCLHILDQGDMAGELGFIDGNEHSASLRAITDSDVFTIHRDQFEELVPKNPALTYKSMRAIMRTVHSILRRMNYQHIQMSNYISKQNGRY